jgi:cell division initiation protein
MELTPQRLREVEFKERWRGYDPEEVDDLLERVAAGLEDFENRVRQATERALRAEQRASEGSDTDETLRRTLVLAQRTADAAIADADGRAKQLLADAERRAADMVTDAEAEARRITEENEARLRENVSSLESARSTLQRDVDTLGRYLTDERERIRTTLHALVERIDADLQRDRSVPAVSEVDVPEPLPAADEDASDRADGRDGAYGQEPAAIDLVGAERPPDAEGDATQAHDVLAGGGPEEGEAGDAGDVVRAADAGAADRAAIQADTPGAAGSADHDLVLSGPGREIDTDDDAFFAQLRGALDDDEPLGPRDEEPVPNHVGAPGPALFDQEVPEQGRLGPFLRRKRRDN